jgi:hypothetical protein
MNEVTQRVSSSNGYRRSEPESGTWPGDGGAERGGEHKTRNRTDPPTLPISSRCRVTTAGTCCAWRREHTHHTKPNHTPPRTCTSQSAPPFLPTLPEAPGIREGGCTRTYILRRLVVVMQSFGAAAAAAAAPLVTKPDISHWGPRQPGHDIHA